MTQAFNLSQFANKVNTSGQADLTTAVTGTLPQANGGTGTTTASNGQLLIGNGSGFTKATLTQGTGISITNASGSITIDNTSTGGQFQSQLFTAPGTWTKPATATQVRITVIGASGGGGGSAGNTGGGGGAAGVGIITNIPVSAPVSVTIGSGGNGGSGAPGGSGGTSSFGSAVSVTGGTGGGYNNGTPGSAGSVTASSGTILKASSLITVPTANNASVGAIFGSAFQPAPSGIPAKTYSTTSSYIAGAAGGAATGGTSGAIVVEFVG